MMRMIGSTETTSVHHRAAAAMVVSKSKSHTSLATRNESVQDTHFLSSLHKNYSFNTAITRDIIHFPFTAIIVFF